MIGNTLSHYKIIEKLGQGGMGEVYLAEDSRLDRKVALKILPQHLSERAELRERFEREARAVSSLTPPPSAPCMTSASRTASITWSWSTCWGRRWRRG